MAIVAKNASITLRSSALFSPARARKAINANVISAVFIVVVAKSVAFGGYIVVRCAAPEDFEP